MHVIAECLRGSELSSAAKDPGGIIIDTLTDDIWLVGESLDVLQITYTKKIEMMSHWEEGYTPAIQRHNRRGRNEFWRIIYCLM